MPIISPSTNDGVISFTTGISWTLARDASSGTAILSTGGSAPFGIRSRKVSSGRGTQYVVARTFMQFSTSDISGAPASANLNIYGVHGTTANFFVVQSTQTSPLISADFDAISGFVSGNNDRTVYKYSSKIESWSTSGYNTIPLNATALKNMGTLSTLKMCLIEADYDLTDTEPNTGTDVFSGVYFAEHVNSYERPYLEYTPVNATFFGANF